MFKIKWRLVCFGDCTFASFLVRCCNFAHSWLRPYNFKNKVAKPNSWKTFRKTLENRISKTTGSTHAQTYGASRLLHPYQTAMSLHQFRMTWAMCTTGNSGQKGAGKNHNFLLRFWRRGLKKFCRVFLTHMKPRLLYGSTDMNIESTQLSVSQSKYIVFYFPAAISRGPPRLHQPRPYRNLANPTYADNPQITSFVARNTKTNPQRL